ncbi:MAG: hypothetical protein R3E08_05195 [Thiotrichaceae bacterium]
MNSRDIHEIFKHLPHRYPFLLIDRVLELKGESLTATKVKFINEPYFQGHFLHRPIMPGRTHLISDGRIKVLVKVCVKSSESQPTQARYTTW